MLVFVFCLATTIALPGQTSATVASFNTLLRFNGTNGGTPLDSLLQATDGALYGTTEFAGTCGTGSAGGTAFRITTAGVLTVLHDFCQGDTHSGYNPVAGLVQAGNGVFYGSTTAGGPNGTGGIFEVKSNFSLSTLASFNAIDGQYPSFSLIQGTDGNLYGSTEGNFGGSSGSNGVVFKISLTGSLSTLFSFSGTNGAGIGPLVQIPGGEFAGLAASGNKQDAGSVFTLSSTGALTTLYNFCSQTNCTDGSLPFGLVLGSDGNLYGTTLIGGTANAGTFFKVTPTGQFTTLHNFCSVTSCADGSTPTFFVQGSDGNFYGTAAAGGAYNFGTVYRLTTSGTLTILHNFCATSGCPDGANPIGVMQDTNGTFYGTASSGGSSIYQCLDSINGGTAPGCGTVFSLSVGLAPFVQAHLTMGKVDSDVVILGDNLTGTTAVSFNGTPATFKVISGTEIRATVPNGATTGGIQVTTPDTTLKTNGPFWVSPQLKNITPTSGAIGTAVRINGVSLTQTSGVAFNGVAATQFTVNSDNEVTATAPAGAATGKITITTAGGVATSEASFNLTDGPVTSK